MGRSTTTDYNGLLSAAHAETKAAVLRDFETQTEEIEKEKEKGKAAKEKEKVGNGKEKRTAWPNRKGEKGKTDDEQHPRWRKPWTKDDWANWNKKKKEGRNDADSTTEEKKEKTDKKKTNDSE